MAGTRKARVPMAEQLRLINDEYSGRFYIPIPEIGNHRSDMKETTIPF